MVPVLLPSLISQSAAGDWPDSADLELTVEAAFGADLSADPDDWEFTDLSSRLIDAPITVQRGVVVGGRTSRTASASVQLLNDDGELTPHHPGSAWWPYVDAGTPMRVAVRTRTEPLLEDSFQRVTSNGLGTADSGQVWAGGTLSAFACTGGQATISLSAVNANRQHRTPTPHRDVDASIDISPPAVTTGAALTAGLAIRSNSNGTNYLYPTLEFQTSGAVRITMRSAIASVFTTLVDQLVPGLTYTAGTIIRLRVLAVGQRIRIKAWLAAGVEPAGWTVDYPLEAGLLTSGTHLGVAAFAAFGNTLPLPIVVTLDNLSASQPRYPRIEGYITDVKTSFRPLGDGTTHSVATVDIGGVGAVLDVRGADEWSPMRRSIQWGSTVPYAYWPLEDGERSTQAASGIAGHPAMTVTGPAVFSFDTGEPEDTLIATYGSKSLCSVAAGARLSVAFTPSSVQNQWTVGLTAQVTAALVPVTEIRVIEWSTLGTHSRWALVSTATGHSVRAYNDTAGTSTTVCSSVEAINTLVGFDIQAVQNGANIDVDLLIDATVYASGSVAGTLGAPHELRLNPDLANTTGSTSPFGIRFLVGHAMVHESATASSLPYYYDGPTLYRADRGWYYEPSHLRAVRLAREGRVPFRLAATPDEATRLNSQPEGNTVGLLTAAVEAESGGLLYESGFGYEMLPRSARYNRAVDLTIDLAEYARSGDTDPTEVLQPVLDVRAPTAWTVERSGGSQAVWAVSEAFRRRRGTITAKATLDLLADADALPHAQWRTHLVEDAHGAHYPGAIIDLAANPGLVDDWLAVTIGSRVQRVNQPTVAGLGMIDQVVEGMTETLARRSWRASIDGAPANVWDVALYDDPEWLLDSASTTLVADHAATSVGASESWQITTALAGDTWETVALPYVWEINGEEITVTAMSAATGSGPWLQTATVTRGANGIVKAHTAGDEVHLARPAIYAL